MRRFIRAIDWGVAGPLILEAAAVAAGMAAACLFVQMVW